MFLLTLPVLYFRSEFPLFELTGDGSTLDQDLAHALQQFKILMAEGLSLDARAREEHSVP